MDELRRWECVDADSGRDLAADVRAYFIPDFTDWRDEKKFAAQLKSVVQGLEAAA